VRTVRGRQEKHSPQLQGKRIRKKLLKGDSSRNFVSALHLYVDFERERCLQYGKKSN